MEVTEGLIRTIDHVKSALHHALCSLELVHWLGLLREFYRDHRRQLANAIRI